MNKIILFLILSCLLNCGKSKNNDDDDNNSGGDGDFKVTGSLGSSSNKLTREISSVTHVMAVNPSSTDVKRVVTEVNADGSFELNIDSNKPWVLVFIDANQSGKAMIVSIFKSQGLDTLSPIEEEGEVNLGEMTSTGTEASAEISYDELLLQLGLSSVTADYIAAVDDLCLRYVNPDIDNNGIIDALEGRRFMLDFHVQFNMTQNSVGATVADLIDSFLSDTSATNISYTGTGIYVAYAATFNGTSPSLGSIVFEDDLQYFPGGSGSATLAAAGTTVSGAAIITNNFGDFNSFGVYAAPVLNMPQGEYVFSISPNILTFTNIETRTNAELLAAEHFIVPFIRFNKTTSGCTSNCTIASIDYKWMIRTDSLAWREATTDEVALTVNDDGAYISIRKATDASTQGIGFTIPPTSITGNIAWTAANANLENITNAQFLATTTTEICHLGLSYDDKIGMRMFSGIQNAPGTCP